MNILKESLKHLDLLRGAMNAEDSVYLFSVIALMVKNDVYGMNDLVNLSKADIVEKLKFKIWSDENLKWFNTNLFTVSSEHLQEIIHFFLDFYNCNSDYGIQVLNVLRNLYFSLRLPCVDSETIVNIFTTLIGPCKGKTIYDGASGFGIIPTALTADKTILRDINITTVGIASILSELADTTIDIKCSNSLTDNESSHGVDIVVSTPPVGLRVQEQLVLGNEYLKPHFLQAKIPSSASESLWIQQALFQLNDQGKAYLLIIPGWLFRGGYDAELREKLIEGNLVESVTLLAAGTLSNSGVEMSIVVLNKAKTAHEIRLIDGRSFGTKKRGRLLLGPEEIQDITDLINGHKAESNFVKEVSIQEVRLNKYSLHCSEYFEHKLDVIRLNLDEQLKELNTLQKEYLDAQNKLNQLLTKI